MNVLQNAAAEFCTSLNENSRLVEVKDVLNFLFLNLNSGQQLTEIEMKIQVYNEKQQARLEVISIFMTKLVNLDDVDWLALGRVPTFQPYRVVGGGWGAHRISCYAMMGGYT